jgi:transcriptional regulator with XRE-family HTH domain
MATEAGDMRNTTYGTLESDMRALRKAAGLSIRGLETATGINRGKLSQLENGIMLPNEEQVRKIARVIGKRPRWTIRTTVEISPVVKKSA